MRQGSRSLAVLGVLIGSALVAGVCLQSVAQEEEGWDVSLALGVNATDGNSDTLTLNGSLTAARATEKHEVRAGVESNYGETEDVKTTKNNKATANYKRKFGGLFLYSDNSIFEDEIAAVDYRAIVGAGVGYYVIDSEATKLSLEIGGAYIREELADADATDSGAIRLAERFDRKLSETAKIWQAVEYLPVADDFDDYLLSGELGVEAALKPNLSLRLVVQDRYDAVPAGDLEENDLAVIGSLVCTL